MASLAACVLIAGVIVGIWFPPHTVRQIRPVVARDSILAGVTLAFVPLVIRVITSPRALREGPLRGALTTSEAIAYGCVGGMIAGAAQIWSRLWHAAPHDAMPSTIVIALVSVPFIAVASTLLFQGWLQTRLAGWIGPAFAVIVTVGACVLLFGLDDRSEALAWFAGALVPSFLRMKTGSLLACIVTSAVTDLCFLGAYAAHVI